MHKRTLEEIETKKARGATIRSRVKWQKVGDKCTEEFFRSVRQKNSHAVISELRDNHGRCFTKREDLEQICLAFYQQLYGHKEISGKAMREVLDDLLEIFTDDMNVPLAKPITNKELLAATMSMTKGKAPGHDGIPIEFFQLYWNSIGEDFHKMVIQSIEKGHFMRE